MSAHDEKAFVDALHAKTVIENVARGGPLALPEVIGTRSWFDARRKAFESSGGRPTDPRWTMKRAIPLAEKTWVQLNELALQHSNSAIKLGPGQVAACLLEEAVSCTTRRTRSASLRRAEPSKLSGSVAFDVLEQAEPRFKEWRLRGPFAGAGT